ncbi:zinc carboxypeptidase [Fulvivirga sp. M361]|uniref:M14 family metallopeptidase n=1 Tax=Fulvivirga sp. M361 TaxID=2594266 RepID=UPI00117B50F4|nr:M14 family metallopeptidase [Fulvivirga sp. M361]TRX50420.1 zinc carboxypeptidase [Fulvivirga sp. M361]
MVHKLLRRSILIFISTNFCIAQSQIDLSYYLPENVTYNQAIPKPKEVIGHELGEWHISHDRLVNYMYAIAKTSERISIKEFGRTFETRPQLALTITSPENHANLENIKAQHIKLTDPALSGNLELENMPAVVYMGYSIHGNEPSGSNAALAVAYYLAAAQGKEIEALLDNVIILLDPSFNPDGLNRFAHFVNSRKSKNLISDPNSSELNEPWPRGRTNHYWFDMNRDWLPVQLPESRARIALFHEWKPNILTDHHEMGSNSTFFFQPGIPSRNNPLTPENNYRLTERMGEYHAKALDKIGSLYYSRESFDDFYFGKGSTYPDINGGVGILFEQASSRGHSRETVNGILRFPFTIRNHFTTSLSTLQAAHEMKNDFLEHQRTFYQEAIREANADNNKAYVFGSKDHYRNYHLAEIIHRHQIKVHRANKNMKVNGYDYEANELFVVPLNQPQYKLIKAIFEKNTTFQDSLFYDVSAWTLPLAFGVDHTVLKGKSYNPNIIGAKFSLEKRPEGSIIGGKSDYAYVFEYYDYYAPKLLYQLLKDDYKVKLANESFYHPDGKKFGRGSILVPVSIQQKDSETLFQKLRMLAKDNGITIYSFKTGLDYKGVSLGSPSFSNLRKPKTAMLVEGDMSGYDAGEVWHLFDQRYDIDLTLLPVEVFNEVDISRYNTLIMVSGNYTDITLSGKEKLKTWIKEGGTVVASKNAVKYLSGMGLFKYIFKPNPYLDSARTMPYADIAEHQGAQRIGGAIFETSIDLTNPLLYGYYRNKLPVFRNGNLFLSPSSKPFGNPITYTASPLMSGYISNQNLDNLKNTSGAGITTFGAGKVIGFTDNMNFRAFWYGTNKVFMNAVMFGNTISSYASR